MAATQPVKKTLAEYDLQRLLSSILLSLPPRSPDEIRALLSHTPATRVQKDVTTHIEDAPDEYRAFLQKFFHSLPNPLVEAILQTIPPAFPQVNPLTGAVVGGGGSGGERGDAPTVWVVVPFQSNGRDGRIEQRNEFLRVMTGVRSHLAARGIALRVRFAEQSFTGFKRRFGQHPLAERYLPDTPGVSTPKFNRGAILNAAINTIQEGQMVFTHDVDLVPATPEFYGAYAEMINDATVLHLAGGWERYNVRGNKEFSSYLGGIAGMTPRGWREVNGYPNDFFGWGGEDDEFRRRVLSKGFSVDDKYYDPTKFQLRDLEEIKTVRDKLAIVGKKETYNLVKDELNSLHAKAGGLGRGGLREAPEITRIINYEVLSADDVAPVGGGEGESKEEEPEVRTGTAPGSAATVPWADVVSIAVLPTAYPELPTTVYRSIKREDAEKPDANASVKSIYQYGRLKDAGYNWSTGEMPTEEPTDSDYDAIRLPVTIYGPGKLPDPSSIRGWRSRLVGLRDDQGNTEAVGEDGKSRPLADFLWMDPTGAFSISYPTTADTMARIIASVSGPRARVIDATACIGGNTSYFAYYFPRVIGIEINPYRLEILHHNLQVLLPTAGDSLRRTDIDTLLTTPAEERPRVAVMDGDSRELLTRNFSVADLQRFDSLGEVLFLDPPWGGPNYMYLPRPLKLEMITRDEGGVSAADFLKPIVSRIFLERALLPAGKGVLSSVNTIAMKVPGEYDIEGLRKMIGSRGSVADPVLIPDETGRNRVFLIIVKLNE